MTLFKQMELMVIIKDLLCLQGEKGDRGFNGLQGLAGENAVIPSNFTMRKYIVGTLILDRKNKKYTH